MATRTATPNQTKIPAWMLLLFPISILVGVILSLIASQLLSQPAPPIPEAPLQINGWLNMGTQTEISLQPNQAPAVYNFSADPLRALLLRLDGHTPNFTFSAELTNANGQSIANFDIGLQNAQFTLAPDNGTYSLILSARENNPPLTTPIRTTTFSSLQSPLQMGRVTLALLDANAEQQRLIERMQPVPSISCQLINQDQESLSLIRVAPNDNFALIGLLSPGGAMDAIGRTDNGWYAVNFAERMGWVSGGVASARGDCAALPLLNNPTIPTAPDDRPTHLVQVDRDGEARFSEAISTPNGDKRDLISVRVINLHTQPPNNYREFTITLECRGEGADQLLWGSLSTPDFRCGDSITLPFSVTNSRFTFAVTLPEGSRQSYVEYELHIYQVVG